MRVVRHAEDPEKRIHKLEFISGSRLAHRWIFATAVLQLPADNDGERVTVKREPSRSPMSSTASSKNGWGRERSRDGI
jgi:hypothetical protein